MSLWDKLDKPTRKHTCCNKVCGQTVAPFLRQTGRGAVCTLTASCYVGVNTNSSFPVTGGNTEASPRLFQHNLRSGLNVGAIKVSDKILLCHRAVFASYLLALNTPHFQSFFGHTKRRDTCPSQQRTVDFSSISGACSALMWQ